MELLSPGEDINKGAVWLLQGDMYSSLLGRRILQLPTAAVSGPPVFGDALLLPCDELTDPSPDLSLRAFTMLSPDSFWMLHTKHALLCDDRHICRQYYLYIYIPTL